MENRKDCDVLSSKYALLVGSRVIPFKARYMSRDLNDCEKRYISIFRSKSDSIIEAVPLCVYKVATLCAKGSAQFDSVIQIGLLSSNNKKICTHIRMEYESAMTSLINDTSIFSGLSQQSTEKFAPKIHVPFHESN